MLGVTEYAWRLLPGNPILLRVVDAGGKRRRDLFIRCGYLGLLVFIVVFNLLSSSSSGSGGGQSLSDLAKTSASLMIAFFRTQRYGQSPHSPKNCLPAAGWRPTEDTKLSVDVPGRDAPIVVNKYVIAHGDEQSVVMYWYQSHNRVVAGEFAARFWLVADAIRYRRSDTALVRVIVPISGNRDAAEDAAVRFVRAVYPDVVRQFPN